jgi:endonuclease G
VKQEKVAVGLSVPVGTFQSDQAPGLFQTCKQKAVELARRAATGAFLVLAFAAPAAATALQLSPKSAFGECPQHFANNHPPAVPAREQSTARALCFESFAVLHSGSTKTPIYVAERLNKAVLASKDSGKRTDRFFADARLPRAERASLEDYRNSGFARGHMAPAGNMTTVEAMAQSFSLANMVPQAPRNNSGAWSGIERATRKYVMRAQGDVFVLTGPVFEAPAEHIGPGRVAVPRYLFKLVYDAATRRAWAHWIENADEARAGRPISYGELVRRTGIDFLPGLHPFD